MKKVILGIVFALTLTSFTLINIKDSAFLVNQCEDDPYAECNELYETVRDAVFAATGDFNIAVTAAIAAEEVCTDEVDVNTVDYFE